jgi:tRNA pseudouridine32 synthase / 23S rRNA pseudouridine746 synthase
MVAHSPAAPSMPFEILYQSPDLLALDKPSGISMFADRSGAPCLWDMLTAELDTGGSGPYPVHRLDKGTSGVLLVALTSTTQAALNRAFAAHRVRKFYVAGVLGDPALAGAGGYIDLPLARGRKSRYRVAGQRASIARAGNRWRLQGTQSGLPSGTRLRMLASDGSRSLLLLQPVTGRTHQLRVHLSWIGHPIVGDHLYGKPASPAQQWPRLALHCHRMVVPLPGRTITVAAPMPAAVATVVAAPD